MFEIMKEKLKYGFVIMLCFALFCCAQEKQEEDTVLAKINDYVLTLDEFQTQLFRASLTPSEPAPLRLGGARWDRRSASPLPPG